MPVLLYLLLLCLSLVEGSLCLFLASFTNSKCLVIRIFLTIVSIIWDGSSVPNWIRDDLIWFFTETLKRIRLYFPFSWLNKAIIRLSVIILSEIMDLTPMILFDIKARTSNMLV